MRQTIETPGECPVCGGPTCVHNLVPPTGFVHCHTRRDDYSCGWSDSFALDPAATEYVLRQPLRHHQCSGRIMRLMVCLMCDEPVSAIDRPQLVGTQGGHRWVHRECLLLNTVGHVFGVCSCTGYGTDHAAALEVLRRVRARDHYDTHCAVSGDRIDPTP